MWIIHSYRSFDGFCESRCVGEIEQASLLIVFAGDTLISRVGAIQAECGLRQRIIELYGMGGSSPSPELNWIQSGDDALQA